MVQELTFWHWDEAVLPQAARSPWRLIGAGATLTSRGAYLSAAAAISGYDRQALATDPTGTTRGADTIAIQAIFQGQTSNPAWSGGASGHVMWIDDGERKLGLSIGNTIRLINPDTGAIVFTPRSQPGGWTAEQSYQLTKRGTGGWVVHVAGRLICTVPYLAAPVSTRSVATTGFGWQDATGTGAGWWRQVEHALGLELPPQWAVDRAHNALPAKMRNEYGPNTRAILRALIGLHEGIRARIRAVPTDITGALLPWREASFAGDQLPTLLGWTATNAGVLSIRRKRLRFAASNATEWITWVWDTPINAADAVYYARATVRIDSYSSDSQYGRVGPIIQIRNGSHRIGIELLFDPSNPQRIGWRSTDSNPGTVITNHGPEWGMLDPYRDRLVELWVVGAERVILVVDGLLIEDIPYDTFNLTAPEYEVRIGRHGQDTPRNVRAVFDVSEVYTAVYYADPRQRTLFLQRIAERCLFFGGTESNARLSAWTRARPAAFARRGTEGSIYEIRRLACDDEADLVREVSPADWYLEVSYPEVTPIFLEAGGDVYDTTAQYRALSPLFDPEDLRKLIEKYLLPASFIESQFRAQLVTELTGPVAGTITVPVESVRGFAAGDSVSIRARESGTIMTLLYDGDAGLSASVGVQDYAPVPHHGTVTPGSNSAIRLLPGNDPHLPYHPWLYQMNVGTAYDSVISGAFALPIATGFTAMARVAVRLAHDGTRWELIATSFGIGTGGFSLRVTNAGLTRIEIWDGAGSIFAEVAIAYTLTVEHWIAARWAPTGDGLTLWSNGAVVATTAAGGFTPLDPPAAAIGVGSNNAAANDFKGDLRDVVIWSRALTNAEMAAIYADVGARSALRAESTVQLAYFPGARSAEAVQKPGHLLAAEQVQAASDPGVGWGRYYALCQGQQQGQVDGKITVTGLQSHRLATITAGNVVRAIGGNIATDEWVEVYGRHNGTGLAAMERLHVVGTTPVVGTIPFSEVYGIAADRDVLFAVNVDDAGTLTTLYALNVGQSARGVVRFARPLICGPSKVGVVADAAVAQRMAVVGSAEGGAYGVQLLTLAGTTRVVSGGAQDDLRVLALGYVPDARTLTIDAALTDPAGTVRLVSNNAGDTQRYRVYYVGADGLAHVAEGSLTGLVSVNTGVTLRRFCGLELESAAIGVVTATIAGGGATVTLGTIGAGADSCGVDKRKIDTYGRPELSLVADPGTARQIVLFGLDESGAAMASLATVDGTGWVSADKDLTRIYGVGLGHLPYPSWVTIRGTAWRQSTPRRASLALAQTMLWSSTMTTEALDGAFTFVGYQQGDLPMPLPGRWTTRETATVVSVDEPLSQITVSPVVGAYVAGDLLRME